MHLAIRDSAVRYLGDVTASQPSWLGMIAIGAALKRSSKDESLSRKIHNRSALEILVLAMEKPLSQMALLKIRLGTNATMEPF
jgi:hypothetical protein